MPVHKVRIVIADEQPIIREGLRISLERPGQFQIVAEAGNGQEAWLASQAARPDILVLDATLKRIGSLDLVRRLLDAQPQLRVIVLIASTDNDETAAFIEAGVHGFVSKSAAPVEFINAVHAALGGGTYFSREIASQAFRARRANGGDSVGFGLTGREIEVLRFICGGFSNKDIARRLDLSVRTVETHRLNIRKKTRAERLRDLVHVARQLGLDGPEIPSPPLALVRSR